MIGGVESAPRGYGALGQGKPPAGLEGDAERGLRLPLAGFSRAGEGRLGNVGTWSVPGKVRVLLVRFTSLCRDWLRAPGASQAAGAFYYWVAPPRLGVTSPLVGELT
jgi:hypothetical protein